MKFENEFCMYLFLTYIKYTHTHINPHPFLIFSAEVIHTYNAGRKLSPTKCT